VPFIARWHGKIPPNTVSDHVSAFWDVLPTLVELAGGEAPDGIDGLSFAPTLLGQNDQRTHAYLYWEYPEHGGQQAVRMGNWKGIRHGLFSRATRTQLYDLATDIGEEHDIAGEHRDTVTRIERIMREGRTASKLFPLGALDHAQ
jgi:arylsulfatase